ncbi:hypothetical protein EEL34_11260 [Muribaculaceae bacterium Isolate-039 (Harlan)]|uniref:Uncharacterized protein n=1 Tax=Duncaniella muris TaxID=2094150 RepID=A0A2V1ISG8_9BACT|nr:hypothetical protein C5O23_02235 [Duncaniella muris]ROS86382.1 hypothetical protein EEL34_11260 [Muribaculaceae bacterium Isolate-039 (Harlan)]
MQICVTKCVFYGDVALKLLFWWRFRAVRQIVKKAVQNSAEISERPVSFGSPGYCRAPFMDDAFLK